MWNLFSYWRLPSVDEWSVRNSPEFRALKKDMVEKPASGLWTVTVRGDSVSPLFKQVLNHDGYRIVSEKFAPDAILTDINVHDGTEETEPGVRVQVAAL